MKESFKIKFEGPSAVVRDFEILGVGSLREAQLKKIANEFSLILETHPSLYSEGHLDFYQKELAAAVKLWHPIQVRTGAVVSFQDEAQKVFDQIFPLLGRALGLHREKLFKEYLLEAPWNSALILDFWSYFVGFIRSKKIFSEEIIDLAKWEWAKAWIEVQPNHKRSGDEGQIIRSPQTEVVFLSQGNSFLHKEKAYYLIFYNKSRKQIEEIEIDEVMALVLDLLEEERKFSAQGLREQVELRLRELQLPYQKGVDIEIEQLVEKGILHQLGECPTSEWC